MPHTYGFKKPVDTSIRTNPNLDLLGRLLFFDIVTGAMHEDRQCSFRHGNKYHSILLRRGQYVLKVSEYEREFGTSHKRILKTLEILSKWHTEMTIEGKPFGTVITLLDYDELVKMTSERPNESQTKAKRKPNESQTSIESVESVESVESEESVSSSSRQQLSKESGEVLSFYNKIHDTKYKSIEAYREDLEKAIEIHGVERIKTAILKVRYRIDKGLFGKSFTPQQLFKRRNKQGPCDYIEEFSNLNEKQTVAPELHVFEELQDTSTPREHI